MINKVKPISPQMNQMNVVARSPQHQHSDSSAVLENRDNCLLFHKRSYVTDDLLKGIFSCECVLPTINHLLLTGQLTQTMYVTQLGNQA